MRELTLDPELAAKAQDCANKCQFQHCDSGENLYLTGVIGGNVGDIGRDAVEGWACERNNIIGLQGAP